jgi:hypothetical protein
MPLSTAERTLWKDMSSDNKCKEISKAKREVRTKEIRQGAVAYVEQHTEDFEGFDEENLGELHQGCLKGTLESSVESQSSER